MQALRTRTITPERLPFFSFEPHPFDDRFGKIRASSEKLEVMGELDYFHGNEEDISEKSGSKEAFFVTNLSLSKDIRSGKLDCALLYIAACLADEAGEEVMYCRPVNDNTSDIRSSDLWEIVGVRKLLDQYATVIESV